MTVECVRIGDATLYCGDALELLPLLQQATCVISDPPYGTGFDYTKNRNNQRRGLKLAHNKTNALVNTRDHWAANVHGDERPFDPAPWLTFPQIILWGAHNYASRLPDSRGWLVWDKRDGTTPDSHGDCELAWTNLPMVVRMHRQLWRGVVRAGEENPVHSSKLHPAQKPVALMRWCVEKTRGLVLDPYMGSGTTGLACLEVGRPFLGVEIDPHYFGIACERLTFAARQMPLFPPPAYKTTETQLSLTSSL
jgi:site-specific DNA-methyltransferase (adenine-specific)